ncbi:MAG: hypothetical protein CMD25_05310 [Flavobacteriales bacterium]|nr:hypothetical protein [Flavobacteriales bacterium]
MNWTNIKKWAKDKGYKVDREKSGDEVNPYNYEWTKKNEDHIGIPAAGLTGGTTNSLSKMAMAIYNDITDNKHVEHQKRYAQEQLQKEIDYERSAW